MSLGFPLTEEFFGTNKDGSKNKEYCKFCYENGEFTKKLTLSEMIKSSINHMTKELNFPVEKAESLSNSIIPHLKRWQNDQKNT